MVYKLIYVGLQKPIPQYETYPCSQLIRDRTADTPFLRSSSSLSTLPATDRSASDGESKFIEQHLQCIAIATVLY